MAYFSQPKGESEKTNLGRTDGEPKFSERAPSGKSSPETVSTLGRGMLVTGNITCAGSSMQVLGRVNGDIHATNLNIGEGPQVDGNVIAQELVIQGGFKGTIHANTVKLQSTAVVDGEIFNKSLTIEQNAQFEGLSRRLDKAVEPPSSDQARGELQAVAEVFPISAG